MTDFEDSYLVDYDELRRLFGGDGTDDDSESQETAAPAKDEEAEDAYTFTDGESEDTSAYTDDAEPEDTLIYTDYGESEDTFTYTDYGEPESTFTYTDYGEPDGGVTFADDSEFIAELPLDDVYEADTADGQSADSADDSFTPSFFKVSPNPVYGTYVLDDDDDDEDDEEAEQQSDSGEEKPQKVKLTFKLALIFACLCLLISSAYAVVVRGNIPFVVKWRNIWIETAMTTDQHKWLATSFFPGWLIDDVMNARVDVRDIGTTEIEKGKKNKDGTPVSGEDSDDGEPEDILNQGSLTVGQLDSHGNEVLVNDLEQNIVILKVKTSNFVGRLVLIDDPSRVFIATTDNKEVRGKFICDYLADESAIVGMNASGFYDPGGVGIGGVVTARTVAQGEYWGTYSSNYITVGFDRQDRLIVGEFSDWEARDMRDAFQYHPALIINGDKVIEGASGWGLQPRTVIGQAKNGMVLFLVVDGRQVGYSLGATMGDCADILEEYGAYNAGACDGGSSSVLAYDGVILNKPSTNMPTGRYLPNAWLVKRK